MPSKPKKPLVTEPILTCPYTGREQELVYDDDTRTSGWFLHGGLDMALPFLSKEDLYLANTMRGGKKNIAQYLKCAYTGEPLEAVQIKNLWYAVGKNTFSPSRRQSKSAILYECSHRNGVPPDFAGPIKITGFTYADEPHEHFVDTTVGLGKNADDAAVSEAVDKMADSILKPKA